VPYPLLTTTAMWPIWWPLYGLSTNNGTRIVKGIFQ